MSEEVSYDYLNDYLNDGFSIDENMEGIDIEENNDTVLTYELPTMTSNRVKYSSPIEIPEEGKLLSKYLEFVGPAHKNIEDYNNYIGKTIDNDITGIRIKSPGHLYETRFENPKFIAPYHTIKTSQPKLTPAYCRDNQKDYVSELYVDVVTYKRSSKTEAFVRDSVKKGLKLLDMPVMVKSCLCTCYMQNVEQLLEMGEDPDDAGGYFIIKGIERTIIFQEQIAHDKIFVFKDKKDKDGLYKCTLFSSPLKGGSTSLLTMIYEEKMNIIKIRLGKLRTTAEEHPSDQILQTKSKTQKEKDKEKESRKYINIIRVLRLFGYFKGQTQDGECDMRLCEKELIDRLKLFIHPDHVHDCVGKLYPTLADASAGYDSDHSDADFIKTLISYPYENIDNAIRTVLKNDILHNNYNLPKNALETDQEHQKRIYNSIINMLCIMISRILLHISGKEPATNRDGWDNKRTVGPGGMLKSLIRGSVISCANKVRDKLDYNQGVTASDFYRSFISMEKTKGIIKKSIHSSFQQPRWGVITSANNKANVSQILNRDSVIYTRVHLDCIGVNIQKNDHQLSIRKIQHNQYGGVCAVLTSEGGQCGIIKAFSQSARISLDRLKSLDILRFIQGDANFKLKNYTYQEPSLEHNTKLIACGIFLGWCNGKELHSFLLENRRKGILDFDVSLIFIDDGFGGWLYVDNTPYRIIRPLLIANEETGELLIDQLNKRDAPIEELLKTGCMEYVSLWDQEYIKLANNKKDIQDLLELRYQSEMDLKNREDQLSYIIQNKNRMDVFTVDEKEYNFEDAKKIAMNNVLYAKTSHQNIMKKRMYTHCEIDPAATLSIAGAMIPYLEYNQAPRNVYQTSMEKQALGQYMSNYEQRFDLKSKLLLSATTPLVNVECANHIGLNLKGYGQTCETMFASFPFTEEDAFVMKKESIEAGMFRMKKVVTYKATTKIKDNNKHEYKFTKPSFDNKDGRQLVNPARVRFISANGVPCKYATLKHHDCVIGRTIKNKETGIVEDASIYLKYGEEGVVDKIQLSGTDNEMVMNVKMTLIRFPIKGDKFAPRCAQKGTIGAIYPEKDLPFSEANGTSPDLITNSHQIPSRMTISYIKEVNESKYASFCMKDINGTAWREKTGFDKIRACLTSRGLDGDGYEYMRSAQTGRRYLRPMYKGPVFFQALKHHSADKIQSRSEGPVASMTRQPLKGRSSGRGNRIGELEQAVILSHGAAMFMRERLCYTSDAYTVEMCTKCGEYPILTAEGEYRCLMCQNHTIFGKKDIPYIFKLLKNLLIGASLYMVCDVETNEQIKNRSLHREINFHIDDGTLDIDEMDDELQELQNLQEIEEDTDVYEIKLK